jgi:hypothetical protein
MSLSGGVEQSADADLEADGEVSVFRVNTQAAVTLRPGPGWRVGLRTAYTVASYDFSGTTGLGGLDPWDNLHLLSVTAPVTYRASNRWSIFGAPLLQFNAESGANLSKGLMGGGIFGASYTVNETLTLGAGMGGISQIEDNALVFPVVFFHWRIHDRWRLGMRGDTARGAGVEISYRISNNLETAMGASYAFHRFRLDDEGVAQTASAKRRACRSPRASYQFHPNISLEVYGGVAVAGNLRLEDQDGHRILKTDVDPAPLAGIVVTAAF